MFLKSCSFQKSNTMVMHWDPCWLPRKIFTMSTTRANEKDIMLNLYFTEVSVSIIEHASAHSMNTYSCSLQFPKKIFWNVISEDGVETHKACWICVMRMNRKWNNKQKMCGQQHPRSVRWGNIYISLKRDFQLVEGTRFSKIYIFFFYHLPEKTSGGVVVYRVSENSHLTRLRFGEGKGTKKSFWTILGICLTVKQGSHFVQMWLIRNWGLSFSFRSLFQSRMC